MYTRGISISGFTLMFLNNECLCAKHSMLKACLLLTSMSVQNGICVRGT